MIRARKKYGQHFLEPAWADKLIASIAIGATDRFLEIGSGPGALTLRLAPRVAHVTAIEVDPQMIAALQYHVPRNVELVQQDFLDFDLDSLLLASGDLRVIGNLPYNVTSPILFKLLRTHRDRDGLKDAMLMVQREVADRIEASPGTKDFGTLSVFVQRAAKIQRLLTLPPGAFRPMPKVHSTVLRFEFQPSTIAVLDEATFEALVRSVFTQRRKTLHNALRPFSIERKVDARRALSEAAIDGMRRPETLQLAEFARLADAFVSRS